jgi:hypothetical protein
MGGTISRGRKRKQRAKLFKSYSVRDDRRARGIRRMRERELAHAMARLAALQSHVS